MAVCPGCGLHLPSADLPPVSRMRAAGECQALYHELTFQTLSLRDEEFVHQHAVDAWTGQHVGADTPRVGTFFALTGLYLALERSFTGREVQEAHMVMAQGSREWPTFEFPRAAGDINVAGIIDRGDLRNALREWMADVRSSWSHEQERVRRLTDPRIGR